MLAQNFLPDTDLGLSDKEHSALIKVLGLLERGELKHHFVEHIDRGKEMTLKAVYSGLFNMDQWCTKLKCGTVACIGGSAELIGGLPRGSIARLCEQENHYQLGLLCYPGRDVDYVNYDEITTEEAATALRSYLTTGKANWKEALK